jgi:hypothetical protein
LRESPGGSPHTDRLRELADEADDADEEVTGQVHVHVGQTGRFQAVEPVTRPDAAPAPVSETPKVAKGAVSILNAVDSWPKAFALLVLALLVAFAIWRGAVGILG